MQLVCHSVFVSVGSCARYDFLYFHSFAQCGKFQLEGLALLPLVFLAEKAFGTDFHSTFV